MTVFASALADVSGAADVEPTPAPDGPGDRVAARPATSEVGAGPPPGPPNGAELGVEPPPETPYDADALSPASRRFYSESKRVSNARAKAALGWRPLYPSYREGLAAVLAGGLAD